MGLKEPGLRGSLRNVSVGIDAIPDSVVSRPQDDQTTTQATKLGVRFEVANSYNAIDGRLSANISGQTTAYIHRVSDASLLGEEDISALSAGDAFRVSADLDPSEQYNFVIDAGGSDMDHGFIADASFPFTSTDVDIVNGANGPDGTSDSALNLIEIGGIL